jgi:hypothetical protein
MNLEGEFEKRWSIFFIHAENLDLLRAVEYYNLQEIMDGLPIRLVGVVKGGSHYQE